MRKSIVTVLIGSSLLVATGMSTAEAAPCLIVTLTGTQGGPQSFNGLADAGTLVRYGEDSNDCGAIKLQFDAGRGTTMRLSQLGVGPQQLNAVFFTHMHDDHNAGLCGPRPAALVFVPGGREKRVSKAPPNRSRRVRGRFRMAQWKWVATSAHWCPVNL